MTLLSKRYATALHRLAMAGGAADAVGADVRALHRDVSAPGARALLTSPDVRAAEREAVLQKLGAKRHQLVQNLIGVLHHRRRLEVLFDLHPEYHALALEQRGEVEGVVETPHALGDAEMQSLTALAATLSGKKVTLTQELRPALLGGVRLRVGNVLFDGSMQQALQQLEQKLMQASI